MVTIVQMFALERMQRTLTQMKSDLDRLMGRNA